jgi:hypothetical protein
MKANELSSKDLMVGDWVMLQGKPYMIDMLNGYQESSMGVEPIPLTPEILNKNGFGCDRNDGYAILRLEDNSELLYYFHEYKLTRFYKSEIIFRCQCVYAHQLQHALRLCGINREIEL